MVGLRDCSALEAMEAMGEVTGVEATDPAWLLAPSVLASSAAAAAAAAFSEGESTTTAGDAGD